MRIKRLGLIFFSTFFLAAPSEFSSSPIQLESFKTYSRLRVRIDGGVTSVREDKKDRTEILLKGLGLADLGAPLGDEEEFLKNFSEVRDQRLRKLEIQETDNGLLLIAKWRFPGGKKALENPKMELFEYRSQDSPEFVMDFWIGKGLTVVEAAKIRARTAKKKRRNQIRRKLASRRVASRRARKKEVPLNAFCERPLRYQEDVFLPFEAVHDLPNFDRWFATKRPDRGFPYFEPKTRSDEARYVRLALSLYRKGKPGLVIRTLDFFEKEHPKSRFKAEMTFLRANTMLKLGLDDQAIEVFKRLVLDAKGSPVAIYAGLYVAVSYIRSHSYLSSLESFLWLAKYYPEHRLNWLFHLGAGEAMYQLRQTDRAKKEYQWVVEHAPDMDSRAMAAYRIGDLHLLRQDYDQALAGYFRATKLFPEQAKSAPEVHINRAEALYWLGRLDEAQKQFKSFLDRYPSSPIGWRATFRLGEIEGRLSSNRSTSSSRKWYLKTINEYPYGPVTTLARLRLITCGDQGGFDQNGVKRFFSKEAMSYDGKGIVNTKYYRDFRELAHLRALIQKKDYREAVDVAIREFTTNAKSSKKKVFRDIYSKTLRASVLALLENGKNYQALKLYNDKSKYLETGKAKVNPDYLLKLSIVASKLNLVKWSKKINGDYNSFKPVQSNLTDRKIAEVENALYIDERLKRSEESFLKAINLWTDRNRKKNSKKVRELLMLVSDESEHSFEKELILSLIDEMEGKYSNSLKHASRAEILMQDKLSKGSHIDLRVQYWIAHLQKKLGLNDDAIQSLSRIEEKLSKKKVSKAGNQIANRIGLVQMPSIQTVIFEQAGVHSTAKKWGAAAQDYARAIDKGFKGNRTLFEYARVLEKIGTKKSLIRSDEIIKKISESEKNDFWKKLALEKIENRKSKQDVNQLPRRAKYE